MPRTHYFWLNSYRCGELTALTRAHDGIIRFHVFLGIGSRGRRRRLGVYGLDECFVWHLGDLPWGPWQQQQCTLVVGEIPLKWRITALRREWPKDAEDLIMAITLWIRTAARRIRRSGTRYAAGPWHRRRRKPDSNLSIWLGLKFRSRPRSRDECTTFWSGLPVGNASSIILLCKYLQFACNFNAFARDRLWTSRVQLSAVWGIN